MSSSTWKELRCCADVYGALNATVDKSISFVSSVVGIEPANPLLEDTDSEVMESESETCLFK